MYLSLSDRIYQKVLPRQDKESVTDQDSLDAKVLYEDYGNEDSSERARRLLKNDQLELKFFLYEEMYQQILQ